MVHTRLYGRTWSSAAALSVTDEERETLLRWSRPPKSAQSVAQRARIVLLAADGRSNNGVADRVGVNQATVGKWRKRFAERRLDGTIATSAGAADTHTSPHFSRS
jgi:transposase-like protein